MTIWALANNNCFREIGDRFGVSIGACYNCVISICRLLTNISHQHIIWPKDEEMKTVQSKFNSLRVLDSFKNVIGCVDGMHIPIRAPIDDSSSYLNRKGYHSLILQGVCDSELRFTDVFFGWPGRSHDASVWENSSIGNNLESGRLMLPPECHLLGDSAYPLRDFLIVPFKDNGHLTAKMKKFNYVNDSSTRIVIEQTFERLKCKFRKLKYLDVLKLERAKIFVVSSIVLHNIIINNEGRHDDIQDDIDTESLDIFASLDQEHHTPETQSGLSAGTAKRNYLLRCHKNL